MKSIAIKRGPDKYGAGQAWPKQVPFAHNGLLSNIYRIYAGGFIKAINIASININNIICKAAMMIAICYVLATTSLIFAAKALKPVARTDTAVFSLLFS